MGTTLRRCSSSNGDGAFFVIHWIAFLYIAIIPLRCYYVRQVGTTFRERFFSQTWTDKYEIIGRADLRYQDVLREYFIQAAMLISSLGPSVIMALYLPTFSYLVLYPMELAPRIVVGTIYLVILVFLPIVVSLAEFSAVDRYYKERAPRRNAILR